MFSIINAVLARKATLFSSFFRFVVLFSSLSFLSSRFGYFFVVLFSRLSFLCSWLGGFVVFFSSLGFLSRWLGGFLVVLFSRLRFLSRWCFLLYFLVLFGSLRFLSSGFFVVNSFVLSRCSGSCSSRSSSCCLSSEGYRRQTHSSGDHQRK